MLKVAGDLRRPPAKFENPEFWEGYVEDKWVIWSVMLFLSVNINPL